MGALDPNAHTGKAFRAVGIAGLIYAGALILGALSGSQDMLRPLAHLAGKPASASSLEFQRFKTAAELEQLLAAASAEGKFVMVDFYADWCVTCIEMEEDTFSEPAVKQALSDVVLLQADVTRNDAEGSATARTFPFIRSAGHPVFQYRKAGVAAIPFDRLREAGTVPESPGKVARLMKRAVLWTVLTGLVFASAYLGYRLYHFQQDGPADSSVQRAEDTTPAVTTSSIVGRPRPEFTLPDLDGRLRSISEWDGKVIALNFWATWCPPCLKEVPEFVLLQTKYQAAGFAIHRRRLAETGGGTAVCCRARNELPGIDG